MVSGGFSRTGIRGLPSTCRGHVQAGAPEARRWVQKRVHVAAASGQVESQGVASRQTTFVLQIPQCVAFSRMSAQSVSSLRGFIGGRGDRIRTYDLLVPNQALYQTKLHPADRTEMG